jgi:hypothetical protein
MTFAWTVRLKYGLLAGLTGWLAGWLFTIPFELSLAWRYVDAHANQLPASLAKGMVVWGAFSLFMAMSGFVPLVLPLFLLVSPRWIVRRRTFLIPGVTLAALLAIYYRMGLLNSYYFQHSQAIVAFFFTAPNFFVIIFALVMTWVYVVLAKRRLSASGLLPSSQVNDPR